MGCIPGARPEDGSLARGVLARVAAAGLRVTFLALEAATVFRVAFRAGGLALELAAFWVRAMCLNYCAGLLSGG